MTVDQARWVDANQQQLSAALASIRRSLCGDPSYDDGDRRGVADDADAAPTALEVMSDAFGLSRFERDVLVLSAGVDLDGSFAALCAEVNGDQTRPYPTFGMALAALPGAHWSALSPGAPLRRWQLIEVGPPTVTSGALRIDERVLHYLAGVNHLDDRVAGYVEPVTADVSLPPSQHAVAASAVSLWSRPPAPTPVIQLCGPDRVAKARVAVAACADLGLTLHRIRASVIPTGADLEWFCRLWDRDATLLGSGLLVACEPEPPSGTEAAVRLVERLRVPVLVATREPLVDLERTSVRLDVAKPTAAEQRQRWCELLDHGGGDALEVDRLVAQFDLGFDAIESAAASSWATNEPDGSGMPAGGPWDACRVQSRPRLDDLAQRVEPSVRQVDLVLPEAERGLLRELTAHVRHRAKVYGEWGFAEISTRGLGITALFAGPSGTGKTMAAEAIARELGLDLYRIDLSAVVSKYIGETEKNLRRVFDAAEEGSAVLLFDEADALFGKRSEVKDSHDRYANIEVGYLLQRMEAYRGLAILTTNRKNALDPAFQRRIRFVVQFPFPDVAARAEIWRGAFPPSTPLAAIDLDGLAGLDVTGGSIRNMAIGAAFLAAEAGEPVGMAHLLAAARTECAKLDKPLPALPALTRAEGVP